VSCICNRYLQGETAYAQVSLPAPLSGRKRHLFCSEFNAGALALAKELRESDVFLTKGSEASAALTFTTDGNQLAECDHSIDAREQRTHQPLCSCLTRLSLAWPVLVVLDERTWTSGADTAKFVEHIHIAMKIGGTSAACTSYRLLLVCLATRATLR
jgi:hypothetical protein